MSFIDYMIAKGDARYLERQPEWLKEIVPNTTVSRDYGIHRSAEKIRDFLHGTYNKYLTEKIYEEKDEEGNVIKQFTGVTRILDPMLLEETIQYNEEGNFDRIIAAELAIALAMKLDPILGKTGEADTRVVSLGKARGRNILFTASSPLFINKKSKLFT